jgi:DNA-directed RNA polymerase sigma subunit (sigma70/sigma32)
MCGDPSTGVEAADTNVADHEQRFAVAEAMHALTPTEAAVINCRFERDLTLDQTAAAVIALTGGRRVSRERIRQIEMKALAKLRGALDADPR